MGNNLRKRPSHASSTATTSDLTSFPSLSPDRSPEGFSGQPALNRALSNALVDDSDDLGRGRRSTLSKLTSPAPLAESGRTALFGDSILTRDFPGALHLADDSHIERLIANNGAIKLIRQYARDLALRDAEFSALRQRADARERELKRMLREVSVSNQDIDRRLYQLENYTTEDKKDRNDDGGGVDNNSSSSNGYADNLPAPGLGGLMEQAMREGIGSLTSDDYPDHEDPEGESTLRANSGGVDNQKSRASSLFSGSNSQKRSKQSSSRTWSSYLFNNDPTRKTGSRASSIMNDAEDDLDPMSRISASNTAGARRKGLDQLSFTPTTSVPNGSLPDNNSESQSTKTSNKLPRSISSWTKLFAGRNSQAAMDKDSTNETRDSSVSRRGESPSGQRGNIRKTPTPKGENGNVSAVASLKRINSSLNTQSSASSGKSTDVSRRTSRTITQPLSRPGASSVSSHTVTKPAGTNSTNLGPVEMDAILPVESRPPTLTHVYNYGGDGQPGELLTDPFGFIYDQHRKKRQRDATRSSTYRLSAVETPQSFPEDHSDEEDDSQPQQKHTAQSEEEAPSSFNSNSRRWQDYLKIATKPTELLSHTPWAGPIVSLTTSSVEEQAQPRSPSVTVDKNGLVSMNHNAQPFATTSTVVADRPEFAGMSAEEPGTEAATASTTNSSTNATTSSSSSSPSPVTSGMTGENEPVRLLLEQLTDLHDSLQSERTVRWNEFLRKVRAERRRDGEAAAAAAAGGASERSLNSIDTPEASLADGEVVGVSGLGNKGKVGRAKWREFRMLVLAGIPVKLRSKVWSECSGASAMRIPGYYDSLAKSLDGIEPDESIVAQIDMDVRRTLTDNVFFRKGPGVARLREVLVSYARRNPEVGYCQGMNLIVASLLLITPTAEDAFWLLASLIEVILPQHYYDHGLMASRADQVVLRQYITQVLPRLSAHLDELGVELEALTFQWFLSIFTDCLSAEALYRVWDVVLCLNTSSAVNPQTQSTNSAPSMINDTDGDNENSLNNNDNNNNNIVSNDSSIEAAASRNGGGSTFLFQVALALLKLNEQQLLSKCSTPAAVYTYVNHQMTSHAISIDGLIQASEALRNVVRREDVVVRRTVALKEMQG